MKENPMDDAKIVLPKINTSTPVSTNGMNNRRGSTGAVTVNNGVDKNGRRGSNGANGQQQQMFYKRSSQATIMVEEDCCCLMGNWVLDSRPPPPRTLCNSNSADIDEAPSVRKLRGMSVS